jgi:cell cycle sensor histidine kinase DivJ
VGDPFFQARASYDRRHDGTGLGLSIVKGLLTLHGGHMEIASRLNEGTRVTISLPKDCERARRGGEMAAIGSRTLRSADAPTDMRVKKSA